MYREERMRRAVKLQRLAASATDGNLTAFYDHDRRYMQVMSAYYSEQARIALHIIDAPFA